MDFKAYYANQQKLVENYLKNRIAKKGISKVDEAMEYSLIDRKSTRLNSSHPSSSRMPSSA